MSRNAGNNHMVIFNVATKATDNDELLQQRITELFPSDNYEVGRGHWLVAYSGTAKELYTKLFPEKELPLPAKNVMILGVGGYFGVAPRDMWEWIATKLGGKNA